VLDLITRQPKLQKPADSPVAPGLNPDDNEWELISFQLDRYDEHVSDSGELNAAFLDQIFAAAGVERSIDDETPDAGADSDSTGDTDGDNAVQ
jgi:hypothetical protein